MIDVAEKATPSTIQSRGKPSPWGEPAGFETFNGSLLVRIASMADEIPAWGYYPMGRDEYLVQISHAESMMASAVYALSAKMKALPYKIVGKPRTEAYLTEMLDNCEQGDGFPVMIEKVITDLLTRDNGAFIEVVGRGNPNKEIIGIPTDLLHMDSSLVWRTHDPIFPVIYCNPKTGEYHKMHRSRVIRMSNHPSPKELARGVGFCAVSRALRDVQIMRDIKLYKYEKVSGRFRRAIGYGSGITPKQFEAALASVDEKADAMGLARYMGIPFVLSQKDSMELGLLDLASIPDGFDIEKDTTIYAYTLAAAFGVDAREFWPATASGATKADASIQHLKAEGKGIGDLIMTISGGLNRRVMPRDKSYARFEYDFTDDEADLKVAQIKGQKVTNVNQMITGGTISQAEGRAIEIAEGVLDETVLLTVNRPPVMDQPQEQNPDDQTQGGSNQEKPETEKPNAPASQEDKAIKVEPFSEKEIDFLFDKFKQLPTLEELTNAS